MTLSPSGSSYQKPVTVANVCRGLVNNGQPVLPLLLLTSRKGPRLPWARPMYLHDRGRISTPSYCNTVRVCVCVCVFQRGLYPPVRLGKPGLIRPWVRPARSERVRRIIPRHMIGSHIERTGAGAGSTAAEQRERRKEHLPGHHDSSEDLVAGWVGSASRDGETWGQC